MSRNLTLGCSFTQSIKGNYSLSVYPNPKQMGLSGMTNDMMFRTFLQNKKVFFESDSCLIQMTTPYRFELWDKDLEVNIDDVLYDQLPSFFSKGKYVEMNPIQVWMKSIWLFQCMVEELLRNSVEVIFLPYMFRFEQSKKPYLFEKNFKFSIDDIKEMFPKNKLLTISEHNPWHYYEHGGEEESWIQPEFTKHRWWLMGNNYYVRHDHLSEHQHELCAHNILKDKDN